MEEKKNIIPDFGCVTAVGETPTKLPIVRSIKRGYKNSYKVPIEPKSSIQANVLRTPPKEAVLSNSEGMTSFKCGIYNIRFRTPSKLKKYTEIKEWDNGYIVVMADYDGIGIIEEYIDLVPILKNLFVNPDTFLKDIQTIKIGDYDA